MNELKGTTSDEYKCPRVIQNRHCIGLLLRNIMLEPLPSKKCIDPENEEEEESEPDPEQ